MSIPIIALDAQRALQVSVEPKPQGLVHEDVTGRLLAAFFAVYRELGYGFVEAVYAKALLLELSFRGVDVQSDVPMSVFYKGRKVGLYSADLLVEGKVVAGVRAGPQLLEGERTQLLNQMRCSQAEVGMLLHFGPRPEFRRFLGRSLVEQHQQQQPT